MVAIRLQLQLLRNRDGAACDHALLAALLALCLEHVSTLSQRFLCLL